MQNLARSRAFSFSEHGDFLPAMDANHAVLVSGNFYLNFRRFNALSGHAVALNGLEALQVPRKHASPVVPLMNVRVSFMYGLLAKFNLK
jgi:hypothetical protein